MQVTHAQAAHEARNLHLEACGHSHDAPFPALPTDAQLRAAAVWQKEKVQAVSRPSLRARSQHREELWSVREGGPSAQPHNGTPEPTSTAANNAPPRDPSVGATSASTYSTASASPTQNASKPPGNVTSGPCGGAPLGEVPQVSAAQRLAAAAAADASGSHNGPVASSADSSAASQIQPPGAGGWTVVAQRSFRRRNTSQPAGMARAQARNGRPGGSSRDGNSRSTGNSVAGSSNPSRDMNSRAEDLASQSEAVRGIQRVREVPAVPAPPPTASRLIPGAEEQEAGCLSASARSNASRSARRARHRQSLSAAAPAAASDGPSSSPALPLPAAMSTGNQQVPETMLNPNQTLPNPECNEWQEVPGRPAGHHHAGSTSSPNSVAGRAAPIRYDRPAHELIAEAQAAHAAETAHLKQAASSGHGILNGSKAPDHIWASHPKEGIRGSTIGFMGELGCPAGPMGPLMDALPSDTLSVIMSLLQPRDLASLSMTCRGLRAVVEEGCVWQALLHQEFPGSQMSASCAADWKHAYLMQVKK